MSSSQHQKNVNSLDKEIADLEKKKIQCEKDIATLQKKITAAQKEISRTKSDSTKSSKFKQITNWNSDIAKKQASAVSYGEKISHKRSKRTSEYQKLQRALSDEQKMLQKTYERQLETISKKFSISDLSPTNFQYPQSKNFFTKINEQNILNDEEYDVFLSHAWEDKDDFVDDLVCEMEKLGIRVWYDTKKLQWGDSLRFKIEDGLKKSKFGIVILSPNYIAEEKYWTKEELNGLFQLESVNGKTILPIWHNLTKLQVMNFSPIIANKKALTTANMTPNEIAKNLKELLDSINERNFSVNKS